MANSSSNPGPGAGEPPKGYFARNAVFFTLIVPAMLLGMGRGFTMPVIPIIADEEFAVGAAAATLAFVAQLAGGVLSTFPTGYIIDRFGRRVTLIGAPLIAALSGFLVFFFATSYAEFLVYMTLAGVAQQMWQMSRLAAIADSVQSGQRGRFITSMAGTQRIGNLAGPLLGGLLGAYVDLRAPFLVFAVMSALAAVPSYYLIKETSPTVLARRSGKKFEDIDTSWKTLMTPAVVVLFAAQYCANIARGGTQGQGGPYFVFLRYTYGVGSEVLGGVTFISGLIGIPIMLLSGQIMDRFGRKRQIVPAAIALGIGVLAMGTTALLQWPIAAFIGAYIWIQLAVSMMAGTMQTLGSDIAPATARGKFFGANRFVAESGSMTNPLSFTLTAWLIAGAGGFAAAFYMWAGAAFVCAALVGRLIQETLHREPAPEKASPS